jgi:hypothetical protein
MRRRHVGEGLVRRPLLERRGMPNKEMAWVQDTTRVADIILRTTAGIVLQVCMLVVDERVAERWRSTVATSNQRASTDGT